MRARPAHIVCAGPAPLVYKPQEISNYRRDWAKTFLELGAPTAPHGTLIGGRIRGQVCLSEWSSMRLVGNNTG